MVANSNLNCEKQQKVTSSNPISEKQHKIASSKPRNDQTWKTFKITAQKTVIKLNFRAQ